MPITFSITCDSEEELAHFLKNLQFVSPNLSRSKAAKPTPTPKKPVKLQATGSPAKKSSATHGKRTVKPSAVVKTKPVVKSKSTTAAKPGRVSHLTPIIQNGINTLVKKGKPFRSKDVVEWVLQNNKGLNSASVTSSTSKLLSQSNLKWKEAKDNMGRPYRVFTP